MNKTLSAILKTSLASIALTLAIGCEYTSYSPSKPKIYQERDRDTIGQLDPFYKEQPRAGIWQPSQDNMEAKKDPNYQNPSLGLSFKF